MPIVDTNGTTNKPTTPALSSEWGGLSRHLIATLYEVDRQGKQVKGTEDIIVKAPLVGSAALNVQLQWQSPFESSGAESKAPMLLAMLQSGALNPVSDSLFGKDSKQGLEIKDFLKSFEGRTGITKLNSTQVFSGMPPLDYSITMLFRAWKDPKKEVMKPLNQLMAWALPKKLADQSTLLSRGIDALKSQEGAISFLLPSESPVMLAINYSGFTIKPVVIESISYESLSPKDKYGDFVSLEVQLKINSLTAIDRNDWSGFMGNTN